MAPPDAEQAGVFYNQGVAHCEKGELDAAIADYSEVIRLNPADAYAYYARGGAHSQNGNQAKAEADFAKAKELTYGSE